MKRHGYGFKTFTFALNPDNTVLIRYIKGNHNIQHYVCTTTNTIKDELCQQYPTCFEPNNIYILIVGGLDHVNNYDCGFIKMHGIAHLGKTDDEYDAMATIAGNSPNLSLVIKHEIGHTFGLDHNKDDEYIMHSPIRITEHEKLISKEEAELLDRHRYFHQIIL